MKSHTVFFTSFLALVVLHASDWLEELEGLVHVMALFVLIMELQFSSCKRAQTLQKVHKQILLGNPSVLSCIDKSVMKTQREREEKQADEINSGWHHELDFSIY